MRLYRYEPSSMMPHTWPSAPFENSRALSLIVAVALAALVLPWSVGAQPRDRQEAALDDLIAARMLEAKCPNWRLDFGEAQNRFAELKIGPDDWQTGGRYADFFGERLSYYSSLVSGMSETRACDRAEAAFGPSGRVRKGWMKRQ
jgi:hypothetical protein